jgi:class 3 adenylate cyclase
MPFYLDRHDLDDVDPDHVVNAHMLDLAVQNEFDVKYLTYWFDYDRQRTYCLVDAPTEDSAIAVHRKAHGLLPSVITPVDPSEVDRYLGRIADPPDTGTEAIMEPAFRTILFTDIVSSTELAHRVGDAVALDLLQQHNRVIRGAIDAHDGREVKHTGDGFLASFATAAGGVECAADIQRGIAMETGAELQVRVGLNAGEPLEADGQFFGLAVNLASRICDAAGAGEVLVSEAVRGLTLGKEFAYTDRGDMTFKGFERPVRVSELIWVGD